MMHLICNINNISTLIIRRTRLDEARGTTRRDLGNVAPCMLASSILGCQKLVLPRSLPALITNQKLFTDKGFCTAECIPAHCIICTGNSGSNSPRPRSFQSERRLNTSPPPNRNNRACWRASHSRLHHTREMRGYRSHHLGGAQSV